MTNLMIKLRICITSRRNTGN